MKTLDEVIKAFECCDHGEFDSRCEDCPYSGIGFCCLERKNDAFYYLKEHRKFDSVDAVVFPEDDNPTLSWDELRQMKSKPVWIEYSGYTPNWEIVENIGAVRGSTGDFTGNFIETNKSVLHKDTQGKSWQAYRKERK